MELMNNTAAAEPTELAQKVIERLAKMKTNKAELALELGISRTYVSQYLAGKYKSDPSNIEEKLEQFLRDTEEAWGDGEEKGEAAENLTAGTDAPKKDTIPQKVKCFQSADYMGVISVCQSCQEDMGLGIIIGRSGYGKTYALKQYAKLPRVAYIECDDMMSCRDLVGAIEYQLGIPKATGGTIHNRVSRIREFLNVNTGYLLIVDEADKLINKYTTAKLEILRGIFDQADVGIVIAGEPKLEADIRISLARFANRVDFYYELKGLNTSEVKEYLSAWDMTEDAETELILRAVGPRNGCFRLFDRTLNNVIRVFKSRGVTKVTLDIVKEASGMMML